MSSDDFPIKNIAPGLTLTGRPRHWQESWSERRRTSRLFVGVHNETILDNLINRHSRPHAAWRKVIVDQVLPNITGLEAAKVRWSQKAGCSCPCSPGFILVGQHLMLNALGDVVPAGMGGAWDFWLQIDFASLDVPEVEADDPNRTFRAAQFGVDLVAAAPQPVSVSVVPA